MGIFLTGAVIATVIDHWVGNIDRKNLRWLYVFVGVLAMISSVLWLNTMKG